MNAKELNEALNEFIVDYANEVTDDIYDGVKKLTPVRSGRARRGWEKEHIERTGQTAQVGNDVPYVKYLEDGTSRMAPVHMVAATLTKVGNRQ